MKKRFDGLTVEEITLYTEAEIKPGTPVTINANKTAVIAPDKKPFIGICTAQRGNYVSVAISGAITVPFTGSSLATGYNFISSDGNGNIKPDVTSTIQIFVLDVDTENNLATILL